MKKDYTVSNTISDILNQKSIPTYEEFSESQKPDLILIFKVGVAGKTTQQAVQQLQQMKYVYDQEQFNGFKVHNYYIFNGDNNKSELEVINPNLSNKDIVTQLKDLINSIDTPEYRSLISQLKSFEKVKDTEQELRTMELEHVDRKLKKIKTK